MKVAIHGKDLNRKEVDFVRQVLDLLTRHNVRLYLSEAFGKSISRYKLPNVRWQPYRAGKKLPAFDLFLSLGGDGTLLETITHIGPAEIPVMGINTGRLGFLATIGKEETEWAVEAVLKGNYQTDQRTLLQVSGEAKVFGRLNFALNDFTLMKKGSSSMITVNTYIDGEFLNAYWADGLIVATPTGSTGYSLSCGGPLVFPHSGNFVITPVSPHNLTARPIVVSDSARITVQAEGRTNTFLVTLDSRFTEISRHARLTITRAPFRAHLVQLEGQHYFKTLRQKLNWGLDIRN
ncbi:MAG: NAD kinase [Cyclobacteriaceae bacterium]|nr:MAG: NAD kinase [Cyclobacteriaceae bacterium]